jgi:hypothetical protein
MVLTAPMMTPASAATMSPDRTDRQAGRGPRRDRFDDEEQTDGHEECPDRGMKPLVGEPRQPPGAERRAGHAADHHADGYRCRARQGRLLGEDPSGGSGHYDSHEADGEVQRDRSAERVAKDRDEQRQPKLGAAQAEQTAQDADAGAGYSCSKRASSTRGFHPRVSMLLDRAGSTGMAMHKAATPRR